MRAAGPELLTPGVFHGNEIGAESGEVRWIVVRAGNQFVLKQKKVLIVSEFDPILDAEARKPTETRVSAAKGEAVFMLKEVDGLREGVVETLPFRHPSGDGNLYVSSEQPLQLQLANGKKYEIRLPNEGTLAVVSGERAREFVSLSQSPSVACLIWAGDLDRDGKLDMVLSLGPDINVELIALFLSSGATPGLLLSEVAVLSTTGC